MSCLKQTYQQGEALEENHFFLEEGLEKRETEQNFCYNYYPFGLQHATSWTRSTTVKNNRLYNAGAELNEHTKNYETFYRQYDPAIGRFTAIDPLATKYTSTTPYNYAFNDPIALNDPMGDDPNSSEYVGAYEMMMMRANPNRGDGYLASLLENGGGRTGQGSGNHWSDGIQYDDWNPFTGSDTYREGLEKGYVDIGGVLYLINNNGIKDAYMNRNGQVGFWERESDVSYEWRDIGNGKEGLFEIVPMTIHDKFVAVDQNGGIKFNTLWDNYPSSSIEHPGPNGQDVFSNHCAINVSEALAKSGVSLKSFKGVKCWNCTSNNSHAIRAQELANWLQKTMPGAVVLTGANFEEYIAGKQGIVFFQDYWQRSGEAGRTGDHIDLWNQNELGSIGVIATWMRTTFPTFSEDYLSMSDLKKSSQVIFWEIGN